MPQKSHVYEWWACSEAKEACSKTCDGELVCDRWREPVNQERRHARKSTSGERGGGERG